MSQPVSEGLQLCFQRFLDFGRVPVGEPSALLSGSMKEEDASVFVLEPCHEALN